MAETEAKVIAQELAEKFPNLPPGHSDLPEGIARAPTRSGVTQRALMTERPPAAPVDVFDAALARWENRPEVDALKRLGKLAEEVAGMRGELEALQASRAEAVANGENIDALAAEAVKLAQGIEARELAIPAVEEKIREELREHYQGEITVLDAEIAEGRESVAVAKSQYNELQAATDVAHKRYARARSALERKQHNRQQLVKKLAALEGELLVTS